MIRNYFTIAVRNLLKHRVFSFINIVGLSVGIACCVMLALYIHEEFSYDTRFAGVENIYRVTSTLSRSDGDLGTFPRTSPPIGMALLENLPELESATRLLNPPETEQHLVQFEDKAFYEKRGYLVDSTFFDVFDYPFSEGDPKTALAFRNTCVLSANVARKLFGGKPALDNLIVVNATDTFRVTGVLKPYEGKSHVDADLYMSLNSGGWGDYTLRETTWVGNNFVYTYLKLRPGVKPESLYPKMAALLNTHGGKHMREIGMNKSMGLQPMLRAHLYSTVDFSSATFGNDDLGNEGDIRYLYILGSICVFILLIACVNFMNLTTAKASQRAGEVGVRKSLGANRANLIGQFLGESMTIVAVAMVLSLGIVQIMLPFFNAFVQKDLALSWNNIGYIVAALLLISAVTGFVAGSYPAFFLSSFQPARVLKDKRLSGGSSNFLRKSLVVFQFVIAITLISAIVVINQQLSFMRNKALGFDPAYRITMPLRTGEASKSYVRLKDRFEALAGVKTVSASSALPSMLTQRDLPVYAEGYSMENAKTHFNISIDENYTEVLNIKLLAGRTLRYETDSARLGQKITHVMVNEASLRAFNIPLDKAVGSRLYCDWRDLHMTFVIEGITSDFHQFSMHREVAPMFFVLPADRGDFVNVCTAVEPGSFNATLAAMEKIWHELAPNTPFEYTLLSDSVGRQYESDERVLAMVTTFTLIAIIISCLGLYGLSVYIAERRVKEIGIRKVLGASVTSIVSMLSKDFLRLVLLAFVLSVPIGYLLMEKWLQRFAYHVDVGATVFAISGLVSVGIAWTTIGFESTKAAMGDPVKSLRNE